MRIGELIRDLGGNLVAGDLDQEVLGVAIDSRQVQAGDLFAALPGGTDHGGRFVADAIQRGACAVLTAAGESSPAQWGLDLAVPHWQHEQIQATAGRVAARLLGPPAGALRSIGITGTNGKTTCAHLLGHLLRLGGQAPAVLGTTGYAVAGSAPVPATHTTPPAPSLQRLLARHHRAGGQTAVMEVSSHALVQDRTAGMTFQVAVFTNLTREHLDYHGNMGSYLEAKSRLFANLAPGSAAVLNRDDMAWEHLAGIARAAGARVVTYSVQQSADVWASELETDSVGSRFKIEGMGICSTKLRFPLRGRFNVQNALAAAAAARLFQVSPETIIAGLSAPSSAPGRMELVSTQGCCGEVYVDYAHSPDALARALGALRAVLQARSQGTSAAEPGLLPSTRGRRGRLIVVFGCGGDRDQGKRAAMGRVACEEADLVIVTSDNPRSESPDEIAEQVLEGTRSVHEDKAALTRVELDRRRAIELALDMARDDDLVLIAGKGHERVQQIGSEQREFDDRQVVRECLQACVTGGGN